MTREQLEHAIRAVCDVTGDSEIWIFGSQAILGQFPNAPESLRASIEVDVYPKNNPDKLNEIDGSLGELSLFHETHGFYVHGISLETVKLPKDWQKRVVKIKHEVSIGVNIGLCIEVHDLAASKLVAFREKDREFVRVLFIEGMVDVHILLTRINELDIEDELQQRLRTWVIKTSQDL